MIRIVVTRRDDDDVSLPDASIVKGFEICPIAVVHMISFCCEPLGSCLV